mmetsp:Transcript_76681/g.183709  ORF Transcript_76681/g.183709 Transcript_76681/m.183709 type:complete len:94 (+) Transcript_76681:521-802(+)
MKTCISEKTTRAPNPISHPHLEMALDSLKVPAPNSVAMYAFTQALSEAFEYGRKMSCVISGEGEAPGETPRLKRIDFRAERQKLKFRISEIAS